MHRLLPTALLASLIALAACTPSPEKETMLPPEPPTPPDALTPSAVEQAPATHHRWTPPPLPEASDLPPLEVTGELVFRADFETAPTGSEPSINYLAHETFRAQAVTLQGPTGDQAALLAGADAETHAWKPALEFRFAPQSNGRLKISFDFYQASYDAGSLNLQVLDLRDGFKRHQTLTLTNDFIQGPGSTDRIFKESMTAGAEARWHRVEWILPLPGGPDAEMAVRFDGATEGKLRHRHNPDGAVNALRFFLQLNRNADIVYLIDNLLIEKLPSLETP